MKMLPGAKTITASMAVHWGMHAPSNTIIILAATSSGYGANVPMENTASSLTGPKMRYGCHVLRRKEKFVLNSIL